jgi:hypothetical protein
LRIVPVTERAVTGLAEHDETRLRQKWIAEK